MENIVILIATKDREEAEKIGEILVKQKLAACANIVANVRSIFFWDDRVQKSDESLLIVKTRSDLFKKAEQAVLANHSYEVPEIIALPVKFGFEKYLQWITDSTK